MTNFMCNACDKSFNGIYEKMECEYIEAAGMCQECLEKSKGLIKIDDHYVHWDYRNSCDVVNSAILDREGDPKYYKDVNVTFPTITFDEKYNKYRVDFDGPDIGGYDIQSFTWYFDSLDDVLKEMLKK